MKKKFAPQSNEKSFFLLLCFFTLFNVPFCSNAQITLEKHDNMGVGGLYFWYSDPSKPVALYNRCF